MKARSVDIAGRPARRAIAAIAVAVLLGSLASASSAPRQAAAGAKDHDTQLAGILLSPRTRLIIDFQRSALA